MAAGSTDQSNGALQSFHHTVRNSLVEREMVCMLGPDRFCRGDGSRKTIVAYADVKSVQLISYAGSGGHQYQTSLKLKGGKVVKIRSHHYLGLGNFEDRTETYAPFIRELCRRIAKRAPDARFVSGSTSLWIVWLVIALLTVLVAVLAVSAVYLPGAPVLPALIVLIAAVPLIWLEARKGPATTFDPADPPIALTGMQ